MIFNDLRDMAVRQPDKVTTRPQILLFGGSLSVQIFKLLERQDWHYERILGMSMLDIPAWLYLDIVTLSHELAWHKENAKRTPRSDLRDWEGRIAANGE